MAYESAHNSYRYWYAKLLLLYPAPYYERMGPGMEQTFNDLLRERSEVGGRLLACAVWMFVDTFVGIIKENIHNPSMLRNNYVRFLIGTLLLLLVPLYGNSYIDGWNWGVFDFVFAFVAIYGALAFFEFLRRKSAGNSSYSFGTGLGIATSFLLVWINAAVGIIGNGDNGTNLIYLIVLFYGLAATILVNFKATALSRVAFTVAAAVFAVPLVSLTFVYEEMVNTPPGILGVFVLNTFFVVLFTVTGFILRRASAQR